MYKARWRMSGPSPSISIRLLLLLLPHLSSPSPEISARLFTYFRSFLDSDVIVSAYESSTYRADVDTHSLGNFVGQVTGKEFNDAFEALQNIQRRAAKSYKNHKWNKNMRYLYWDGFTHPLKSNNGSKLNLEHNERYQADVNLNESAINLPLDVYDNWTDVRNTLQWTKHLDTAFIENHAKKADNIFWQYIGTPQGVMRTYPATFIPAKDQVNFDVRRRPWYNAGIGCPKDVILLVDTSGSLEGFPTRLLKNTATKFIREIISDTDFVTAIDVGDRATFLTCYNHLTRANKVVKKSLEDAIHAIRPNGTSNWAEGFQKAFDIFENSRKFNQTTGCEKTIVIFTDETGQPVDEMVAKLNHGKQVRIFVFSFRKNEGLYSDRLKGLACSNRGYYSKILYFGQIEAALQRLVQIGNTPLKDKTVSPTWSNAYKDLGGFGLVITVTLPVVVGTSESERLATSINSNNSVSLLGIVGLDFKSSRIIQISSSVLPISSSSVIVNNKGYPVYHPRIDKYKYEDVNTKFHNFQWTDQNKQDLIDIEKKMIDREHFVLKTKGFLNYEFQKRGSEWYQDMIYEVYPVQSDSTPFSIACIYPVWPPSYLLYKQKTLNIEDIVSIISKTWEGRFLDNFQDNSCNVKRTIERKSGPYDLDDSHVCSAVTFSILTDIYLSNQFKSAFKWPTLDQLDRDPVEARGRTFARNEIISHFIITYTGMVFYSNPEWSTTNTTRLSELSPYAQTIKDIPQARLFVSQAQRREQYNFRSINITERVTVTQGGVESQVAAVGVELRLELVRQRLLAGFEDSFERFLVDENGEVLMGYPTDRSGHLGEAKNNPFLIEQLLKKNIYNKINYTECINECKETVDHTYTHAGVSSIPNFKLVLYHLLGTLLNFVSNLKLLFYTGLLVWSPVQGNHIIKERVVECCRMFQLYQRNFEWLGSTLHLYVEGVGASGCVALYEVSPVPQTNMLLVVDLRPDCEVWRKEQTPYKGVRVDQNQGCRAEGPEHSPQEHELRKYSEEMIASHYYKSSKTCILNYEDEGMCNGGRCVKASYFLVFSVIIILKVWLWNPS